MFRVGTVTVGVVYLGVNKDSREQVETAYQSWHGKGRYGEVR